MSLVVPKSVFRLSNQAQHKLGCTRGFKFQIYEVEGLYFIFAVKTKALISCMVTTHCVVVTTQLIFAFVFAYAKSRFSKDAAPIVLLHVMHE